MMLGRDEDDDEEGDKDVEGEGIYMLYRHFLAPIGGTREQRGTEGNRGNMGEQGNT